MMCVFFSVLDMIDSDAFGDDDARFSARFLCSEESLCCLCGRLAC